MTESVRVRVPASTANLGSGFDALGMALGLYDTVEITPASELQIEIEGEGAQDVPRSESHLVLRAMRAMQKQLGAVVEPVHLRCHNNIPHSRGLGSSASAIVAGVAAAYGLHGEQFDDAARAGAALQVAAEFEGHADNVAASLLGGLVIAWSNGAHYHAVGRAVLDSIRATVFVPEQRSSTEATRGLLPAHVPHADAAFAAGRSALAVHGLTADPSVLLAATADRLHQPYRASAWSPSMDLIERLRADGIAACISGAGPVVIALSCVSLDFDEPGFTRLELPISQGVEMSVGSD